MTKPSKETLEHLYFKEKKSPEKIGILYARSGRTVRDWMYSYGIELLGATHLITGKPAPWNSGPKPAHVIDAMRKANTGRVPHNKGKGNVSFKCEACGSVVIDKPYRRRRTCSKECRGALRGKTHWNYRDGGVAHHQRERMWAECKEWRLAVLRRDRRKCLACSSTKRLVAHHLDGWAKHPELRFDVDNGATMCHDCHWQFHRDTSHRHATKAMFNAWLEGRKRHPSPDRVCHANI